MAAIKPKNSVYSVPRCRRPVPITEEKWEWIAEQPCTINGHKARVVGRYNRFGTVTAIYQPIASDWSWEAIVRILDAGGTFKY